MIHIYSEYNEKRAIKRGTYVDDTQMLVRKVFVCKGECRTTNSIEVSNVS
jgi:hypothetical protein